MSEASSKPVLAAAWMTGSIVSFTSMAVAGRELSFDLDTFEIMFFRSLLGIVVVVSVAVYAGTIRQVSRRNMRTHLLRNISHFAGQNFWFFAIAVAPLAQVFALEFTQPIWVMFLALIVLKEPLTKSRALTAFVGFAGVLIVTQPWNSGGVGPGVIAGTLAAVGFAGSAVFTRLLTRTETITCILFWMTVLQAIFGLAFAGFDGQITLPSAQNAPWLVLVGIGGLVAHFCLTKALSLAPASVVVPLDFARLPLIALVGMVLYNEPLPAPVILGAAIIFAANYYNIIAEKRLKTT